MTKKDYVLVARVISEDLTYGALRRQTAERLADAFEKDNPRFDRKRFLSACNVCP